MENICPCEPVIQTEFLDGECVLNIFSGFFFPFQLQFSLEPEPIAINCTAFNHNGNLLVTGAADGIIRLFGKVKVSEVWFSIA